MNQHPKIKNIIMSQCDYLTLQILAINQLFKWASNYQIQSVYKYIAKIEMIL